MKLLTTLLFASSLVANAATVITSGNISWTITESVTTGQYVTGQWWALDPGGGMTVTAITRPAATATRDGSMLNPSVSFTTHGYDSRVQGYNASTNVANSLPLTVVAGDTLISTISRDLGQTASMSARPAISDCEALTIVASAPSATAFRPWYVGGLTKVEFDSATMLTNLIDVRLTAPASATALSSIWQRYDKIWLDHRLEWQGDYLHPSANMNNYGAEIARDIGDGLLHLLHDADLEDKHDLLLHLVQLGIDHYGIIRSRIDNDPDYGTRTSAFNNPDGVWGDTGGTIGGGRKSTVILAGMILNYEPMRDLAIDEDSRLIWMEDGQYHELTQFHRDETYDPVNCSGSSAYCHPGYFDAVPLGTIVWGERTYKAERLTSYDYHPGKLSYRKSTSDSQVGHALFIRAMGWRSYWNFDPSLDYFDTDQFADEIGDGFYTSQYTEDMWALYSDYQVPVGSLPPPPSGLSATAVSTTQIDLAWTDNSSDEDGWTIERSTTSGSGYAVIDEAAANETTYSDTGLSSGTTYYYRVASSNAVGQSSWTTEKSATTFTQATKVAAPEFSTTGGNIVGRLPVTLSSATSGATIYYTVDGSTPTDSDHEYQGALYPRGLTTVRAIGTKASTDDSDVVSYSFDAPPFGSIFDWQNATMPTRTNDFSLGVRASVTVTNIDAVIAFSDGVMDAFTDAPILVRFNPFGQIDVRNGGAYNSDATINYVAGTEYLFLISVDFSNTQYSVTVNDGTQTIALATDYDFRADQSAEDTLNNMGWITPVDPDESLNILSVEFVEPSRSAGGLGFGF